MKANFAGPSFDGGQFCSKSIVSNAMINFAVSFASFSVGQLFIRRFFSGNHCNQLHYPKDSFE